MKRELTRDDIMPIEQYGQERQARRRNLIAVKKRRRMEVGPVCTFYFESYETMWNQVYEMLFIEKGGEQQIADELSAYNPLIPKGTQLVATVMFEIDDPLRRKALLQRLGGVEETAFTKLGEATVKGIPEDDVDRTSTDGKASSVQFIHFPFARPQADAFKAPGTQVILGFGHPEHSHMAVLPEPDRAALSKDFES